MSPTSSTIGRFTPLALRIARGWFRLLTAVSPELAERRLAERFLTPRRSRPRRAAGGATAALLAEPSRWVRSGDFRVAVYESDAANDEVPATLLVHGWEGSTADLSAIGEALIDCGHRVVAIDLPAHGRSSGKQSSLADGERAVRDVVAAAGPFATIVGHSYGAAATVLAVSRALMRVRVSLIAPPNAIDPFVARLVATLALPERHVTGVLRHLERLTGERIRDFDLSPLAPALGRVGALVVHDEDDGHVPFADSQALVEAWPGARFIATRGLGHSRLLRDPAIVGLVVRFASGPAVRATVAAGG